MKEIPVTINVTAEDIDAFSHILEMESEGSFLKLFSERFFAIFIYILYVPTLRSS